MRDRAAESGVLHTVPSVDGDPGGTGAALGGKTPVLEVRTVRIRGTFDEANLSPIIVDDSAEAARLTLKAVKAYLAFRCRVTCFLTHH